jgi:hypothetical protein
VDAGGAFNGLPAGVAPSPRWRGTIIGNFKLSDALSVSVLEKWRSGFNAGAVTSPANTLVYNPSYIDSIFYTSLTVSYDFTTLGANWQAYGNVQNLFDAFPQPAPMPTLANAGRGINPMGIGDDPVGRYFVVGLKMRID